MLNRRILLVVSLLALSSLCMAEFPLKVMTFNVRYGTAMDGKNSWHHRRDIVADCIKAYDPDIVGMQECLEFQADFLVEQLPEYASLGMAREADGRGEFMTILYRKRLVAPMEAGNFWLSETPDVPGSQSWETACTRMVTWARFYHYEAKRFFYHFNTHFDHVSEPARQGAARLLSQRTASLAGDAPVVVTGDFNAAAEQSEPWRILTQGGLTDAWITAQERIGAPITMSRWTAPEDGVDRRIDWILLSSRIKSERCETVLFNRDGRYPSDHYPVFAQAVITD